MDKVKGDSDDSDDSDSESFETVCFDIYNPHNSVSTINSSAIMDLQNNIDLENTFFEEKSL